MYHVTIKKEKPHGSVPVAYIRGESWEVAKWMQDQAKQLRKEPYMAPRLFGEGPLPGLEES